MVQKCICHYTYKVYLGKRLMKALKPIMNFFECKKKKITVDIL